AAVAAQALGPEHVHGVAMPSRFSSPGSKSDAEAVARALGIDLQTIPIEPVFGAFLDTMAPAFAGRPRDAAEENLQARIRGTILMALSNKLGHIVLSTGNKSEIGVGYCTLYGDMAGGLAVISDVPKTLVYRLSHYVNSRRPVIPKSTLEKEPSAELRPNQKDSDSLPPYEVLDTILEDYIEDNKTAEQIASERGYDLALVRKIALSIERNEYKRQQAAPSLKISEKAFGVGRRFPIAAKVEL